MRQSRYGPNVHPPVIDEVLAEELDAYRGRWVAIDDGHVIAVADDLLDVVALAEARSVPDPLLFRVPNHPGRPAFYTTPHDAVV